MKVLQQRARLMKVYLLSFGAGVVERIHSHGESVVPMAIFIKRIFGAEAFRPTHCR